MKTAKYVYPTATERDLELQMLREELDQWRRAKRRVFWRVRWFNGNHGTPLDYDHRTKSAAVRTMRHLRSLSNCKATRHASAKLYRVTVRPRRMSDSPSGAKYEALSRAVLGLHEDWDLDCSHGETPIETVKAMSRHAESLIARIDQLCDENAALKRRIPKST